MTGLVAFRRQLLYSNDRCSVTLCIIKRMVVSYWFREMNDAGLTREMMFWCAG